MLKKGGTAIPPTIEIVGFLAVIFMNASKRLFTLSLSGLLIFGNISPAFAQAVKLEKPSNDFVLEERVQEEPQQKLDLDDNKEQQKEDSKDEDSQKLALEKEKLKAEQSNDSEKEKTEDASSEISASIISEATPEEVEEKKQSIKMPELNYSSFIQFMGWQKGVTNGFVSGTVGANSFIEAIKISLSDDRNDEIIYRTFCQKSGWTDWSCGDTTNRIAGDPSPIEAMQVKLTGETAEHFDIYYRVNLENLGWLDWIKNGETAGTFDNQDLKIQAYQIKIVEKDRDFKEKEPQIINCSADLKSADVINAHIAINNPENVVKVKFIVWSSEIGLNDQKWYLGNYTNGEWSALINIDEHQFKRGEYQIRCYVDCVNKETIEKACTLIVPEV